MSSNLGALGHKSDQAAAGFESGWSEGRRKHTLILALLLSFSFIFHSYALAFRCGENGTKIADEGMHKYQILSDCGPPATKQVVGVNKRYGGYRIVEEWVYILNYTGTGQIYVIRFDGDGIAVKIDWLGRVGD